MNQLPQLDTDSKNCMKNEIWWRRLTKTSSSLWLSEYIDMLVYSEKYGLVSFANPPNLALALKEINGKFKALCCNEQDAKIIWFQVNFLHLLQCQVVYFTLCFIYTVYINLLCVNFYWNSQKKCVDNRPIKSTWKQRTDQEAFDKQKVVLMK